MNLLYYSLSMKKEFSMNEPTILLSVYEEVILNEWAYYTTLCLWRRNSQWMSLLTILLSVYEEVILSEWA